MKNQKTQTPSKSRKLPVMVKELPKGKESKYYKAEFFCNNCSGIIVHTEKRFILKGVRKSDVPSSFDCSYCKCKIHG